MCLRAKFNRESILEGNFFSPEIFAARESDDEWTATIRELLLACARRLLPLHQLFRPATFRQVRVVLHDNKDAREMKFQSNFMASAVDVMPLFTPLI